MTEEEAKNKMCPISKAWINWGSKCRGSECMAWEQKIEKSIQRVDIPKLEELGWYKIGVEFGVPNVGLSQEWERKTNEGRCRTFG